ncbi:hypothetical protein N7465_002762 [Penicillium sp. CMV-2018d]|nr:hypothetical protein N7465_002762 [Penicillium sp. CMV-2018d]
MTASSSVSPSSTRSSKHLNYAVNFMSSQDLLDLDLVVYMKTEFLGDEPIEIEQLDIQPSSSSYASLVHNISTCVIIELQS